MLNDIIITQYTGLKDKNGKEIYEGDILKRDDGGTVEAVEWRDGVFRLNRMDILEAEFMEMVSFEVVGNIYENPNYYKNKV